MGQNNINNNREKMCTCNKENRLDMAETSLPYPTLHYPLYFSNRTFLHFPNRTFPKKIIKIHLMRSYLGTLAMKRLISG
jgi:hypothetical protein